MSCGSLTVSGYEIAAGAEKSATVSTNHEQGTPLLWIVPISAILIAAAHISRRAGAKAIVVVSSIISLLVMTYKGFDVKDTYSESVHILWGFWMTLVGFILCMVNAITGRADE
jgi:hypothetical protein